VETLDTAKELPRVIAPALDPTNTRTILVFVHSWFCSSNGVLSGCSLLLLRAALYRFGAFARFGDNLEAFPQKKGLVE
jgi:hypothetical protein